MLISSVDKTQVKQSAHKQSTGEGMEILDGGEPFLHWDRNLSELSEGGENDGVLYSTVSIIQTIAYMHLLLCPFLSLSLFIGLFFQLVFVWFCGCEKICYITITLAPSY